MKSGPSLMTLSGCIYYTNNVDAHELIYNELMYLFFLLCKISPGLNSIPKEMNK